MRTRIANNGHICRHALTKPAQSGDLSWSSALCESYSTGRPSPTSPAVPKPILDSSQSTRSPRVNSIIYIVGLVVVVVAVLSFFGLR
jgi:hypothetical protein